MTSPVARDDGLSVGVDLGATQVRAALVDRQGTVLERAAAPTDMEGGARAVVRQIERLIHKITQGRDPATVIGVGVGAPGPLDGEAGVVWCIPTLPGWVDIPLVEWLGEALGRPVTLDNDGVAAAIGEWRFGAGRGLRDFIYITVSTGIGGGVIADGRVLRGRGRLAAHVGHMTIDPQGAICSCGNRGCWEALASGTALGDYASERVVHAPDSALARRGLRIDARDVVQAARAGDEFAMQLMAREAELLGIGIVNLLHLYSPATVVIGGGLSNGFDLLHAGIERQLRVRALPPFRDIPVVSAQLGQDAGVVGAASLVFPGEPP